MQNDAADHIIRMYQIMMCPIPVDCHILLGGVAMLCIAVFLYFGYGTVLPATSVIIIRRDEGMQLHMFSPT